MSELLGYAFFRNALAAVAIISVAAAVIGTYITTRRLVAISGGITHACFGGLGLGYYLGWNPFLMAGVFAVASALGVDWMAAKGRVREDSAIAVIWALGMAVGVLFVFLTPGYVPELNSFLFGNILTVSRVDLAAFAVYTVFLILFFAAFYRKIVAIAFDSDFARVSGLPVRGISLAMTVFIAVGIVLVIRLVGVMLLMSMIALPPMIAETFSVRYKKILFGAVAVSMATALVGLVAAAFIDVPASATIVITQVAAYAAARAIKAVKPRL